MQKNNKKNRLISRRLNFWFTFSISIWRQRRMALINDLRVRIAFIWLWFDIQLEKSKRYVFVNESPCICDWCNDATNHHKFVHGCSCHGQIKWIKKIYKKLEINISLKNTKYNCAKLTEWHFFSDDSTSIEISNITGWPLETILLQITKTIV